MNVEQEFSPMELEKLVVATVCIGVVLCILLAVLRMILLKNQNLHDRNSSVPRRDDLAQPRQLDLSNKNLTSLPEEVSDLVQLKVLRLRFNKLTSLPERIGDLAQLKVLDLVDNQLTSLPERIGDLTQLSWIS